MPVRPLSVALRNLKTCEDTENADRDAQFLQINGQLAAFAESLQPVNSADTWKKEPVGDFFGNSDREWRSKGSPEKARVHDFAGNQGLVNA